MLTFLQHLIFGRGSNGVALQRNWGCFAIFSQNKIPQFCDYFEC